MVLKRVFSLNTDFFCYVCSLSFIAHTKIFFTIHSTVTWILNACSALHCCLFTYWIVDAIFKIQLFLSMLLYAVRSPQQTLCSHTISSIRPNKRSFSQQHYEWDFFVLNTSLSTQNLLTAVSSIECRKQAAFVETRSCSRSWMWQGSKPACLSRAPPCEGTCRKSESKISGLLGVNPEQQIQVNHLMRASRTCHQRSSIFHFCARFNLENDAKCQIKSTSDRQEGWRRSCNWCCSLLVDATFDRLKRGWIRRHLCVRD